MIWAARAGRPTAAAEFFHYEVRTMRLHNCAFLFVILFTLPAVAAPPKVVESVPANDATNVDPSLREIKVTFDQDMDMNRKGFSICGGGPKFPKIIGNPRWTSKRVLVMRVTLQPDHDYALSINCPSAQNCRSVSGESAQPYPISFRTASAASRPASQPGSQPGSQPAGLLSNAEAFKELQRAIDEDYSYRDLHKIDWKSLFAAAKPSFENAKSPRAFAEAAARLLAKAHDIHMSITVGNEHIPTFRRSVRPNLDFDLLPKIVPNWQKWNLAVYTGRFDDNIGYILINTWERSDQVNVVNPVHGALKEFGALKGLIIDVRPNSGGAEPLALQVAGCFIDKPVLYSKHVYRDPDAPGGFTQPQDRILEPSKKGPQYRGKIAVLMGPANMSSCESFLLMMKQVPNCKLIGEKSYGSSGNPKPHDLGNGVTVYVPSWKDLRPDGTCFEGEGITPDVAVKYPAKPGNTDPVLDAALQYLRKAN
jgi:hypothetical protein